MRPVKLARASGILLHPTSLGAPLGIGDLGPAAERWIDFLAVAGQKLWQVLPLGPTGYGDSPYQSFSSFAGNPLLISPEKLVEDGLLEPSDLASLRQLPADHVDFGAVIPAREALLDRAFERFEGGAAPALEVPLAEFANAHAAWLEDFARFMALKGERRGAPWTVWEAPLRDREPAAQAAADARLARPIASHRFRQFLFFRQWSALRDRARERGIRIVGDLPLYVAHDSADVWARRDLFQLDHSGAPTAVAGVPPDYFSKTGQRWGNPLYAWDAHAEGGFVWWIGRLRASLELVDLLRLDHFRGLESYWEIPASAPTAETGRWVEAPGAALLEALRQSLGDVPFIAEDLGVITPEVLVLRDRFGLPGMRVLQFAFSGDPENPFLPEHHVRHSVVYTGTHDNDTSRGWLATATKVEREQALRVLQCNPEDFAWAMLSAASASVAEVAIAPLQDALDLGSEARMNFPGRESGNWTWRCAASSLTPELAERLRALATRNGR